MMLTTNKVLSKKGGRSKWMKKITKLSYIYFLISFFLESGQQKKKRGANEKTFRQKILLLTVVSWWCSFLCLLHFQEGILSMMFLALPDLKRKLKMQFLTWRKYIKMTFLFKFMSYEYDKTKNEKDLFWTSFDWVHWKSSQSIWISIYFKHLTEIIFGESQITLNSSFESYKLRHDPTWLKEQGTCAIKTYISYIK